MTRAMVTAINPDNSLDVTTPEGLQRITAAALVLATGARERPRPARLIPGDRPAGVYTTGHLQTSCICSTARSANAPWWSVSNWSVGQR